MKPLPYCTTQMLRLMHNIADGAVAYSGISEKHVRDALSAAASRGWVYVDRVGNLQLTEAGTAYLKSKEKK